MVGNLPDPAILRTPLGRSQKGSKNGTPRGLRLGAGPEIEEGVKAHRGGGGKAHGILLMLRGHRVEDQTCILPRTSDDSWNAHAPTPE